jgi:hypothetical protein
VKKKTLKKEVEDLRTLLVYQLNKNMDLAEENAILLEELEALSVEYELIATKNSPHTLWETFKAERGASE